MSACCMCVCVNALACVYYVSELPLPPSPLSLSQVRDSTWRLGSCSVVVAIENHTELRVEGVDQRLEETSCGWRLWISSHCFTCTVK